MGCLRSFLIGLSKKHLSFITLLLSLSNPNRCNGDFLTRLISRASPRLQNFFAISDWLMDCLRSFWLVKIIFLLLFLEYAIQSGAMLTFARFFPRFPSATYFVTDCFLFVVFFVLIVIVQSKLLCFCSCDIQMKTVQKTQQWSKWFTPPTKTSNLER